MRRLTLAAFAALINLGHFVFLDPVLAIYWQREFGLSEKEAGQTFSYSYFGYAFGTLLSPVLYRLLNHRMWIFLGLLIESAAIALLIGPSLLLGVPNHLWLVVVAMTVARFLNAYVFIAIIPEMGEAVAEAFDLQHLPPELGDKVSVIFGFFIASGSVLY